MYIKKIGTLFFIAFVVLTPAIASAQANPLCWQKEQCIAQRKASYINGSNPTDKELEEGFIANKQTKAVCGEKDGIGRELGFCLPISQSETKIAFGGEKKFAHLGEFIQVLYEYSIVAAGVLALVMLIVAGFIWTTSGGNSERIGSAKKRIAGALMGLFLAVLSYTLLNTLNPALVNLRLPQIWSVNTLGLAPTWCPDVKDKNVALMGPSSMDSKKRAAEKEKLTPDTKYEIDPKKATCGNDYFVEGTDGLSCSGRSCEDSPSGNLCLDFDVIDNQKIQKYHCVKSNLVLNMRLSGLFTSITASLDIVSKALETTEETWIDLTDDNPELWGVCEDSGGNLFRGNMKPIPWGRIKTKKAKGGATIINKEMFDYHLIFPNISLTKGDWCKTGEFKGIFVMLELKEAGDNTDPDMWIGQATPKDTNHSSAVAGTWLLPNENGQAMAYKDYIPAEYLAEGVILDVDVTDTVFQTIEDYTGFWRSNQMPEKDNTPSEPKCWESEKKKKLITCPPGVLPTSSSPGSTSGSSVAPAAPAIPKIKGCFLAGTPVTTDMGHVPIEQLNPDVHSILSKNFDTNKTSYQPFKSLQSYEVNKYYMVNDGLLQVTGSHPIYVKKADDGMIGWGRIDPSEVHPNGPEYTDTWATLDIAVGDYVLNAKDMWVPIKTLEIVNTPTSVYNLEYVSDGHTFYANDILVHNKSV